jgi:hypothetical protein
MYKNIFSKSFWGLDWKDNLLTFKKLHEYQKELLTAKSEDLNEGEYQLYSDLLESLIQDEKERLSSIETKALQFVGQVSIVTTILGLFVPSILDKVPSSMIGLKIALVIGVAVIALLFVYSIICALRNSNVSKFIFVSPSEDLIPLHQKGKLPKLKYEIINDKLLQVKASSHTINAKASNVIYSFRAFKAAMIVLLAYMIIYSVALIMLPEVVQKVELSTDTITKLKEARTPIQQNINIRVDTTTLHLSKQ